jgi:feruloyl esterase
MCTRFRIAGLILGVLGVVLAPAAEATLSDCNTVWLNANAPANTSIQSATVATLGKMQYCQIEASMVTDSSLNDVVHYELDLPDASVWNRRLEFQGNSGFAGEIQVGLGPLQRGWAVAQTDTGHQTTGASWALNNDPAVEDFRYRAVHNSAVSAEAIIQVFYGTPYHSYFDGCSTGGRQALVEAQLYPEDFDGIVAGDPAIGSPVLGYAWNEQTILGGVSNYIDPAALKLVDQAVINQCGDPGGPAEGLILNPSLCAFELSSLQCVAGQTRGCLSAGQIASFKAIFAWIHDTSGNQLYPGFTMSDVGYFNSAGVPPDHSWTAWITGCSSAALTGTACPLPSFNPTAAQPWSRTNPRIPAPSQWALHDQVLKYFVFNNPKYNSRTVNLSDQTTLDLITSVEQRWGGDGMNPNLGAFVGLNHKLLMYHGWSDPALTPYISVDYFNSVAALLGRATTGNVRLFMIPGMEHCGGGPGPNVFDPLTPLVLWTENGTAPDAILASHYVNNNRANPVDRTMPLCKYPELPAYTGPAGDANNAYNIAANWVCK